MNEKAAARFWANVDKTQTCWIWTGKKLQSGYGWYRSTVTHRLAYEMDVGPIPTGMVLDHRCFNKACVNPEHLRAVTQKQNQEHRKGTQRNNTSGARGVGWVNRTQKWKVTVIHERKSFHGGYFHDLKEAEAAAIALRNSLYTHNDADRTAAALEVAA